MLTKQEIEKIEKIHKLLKTRVTGTVSETIILLYSELKKETGFEKPASIKSTLNLIMHRSDHHISWESNIEQEMSFGRLTQTAEQRYIPPVLHPPTETGVKVHVSDPTQLAKYFKIILNQKIDQTKKSEGRLIEKDERGNYLYDRKIIEIDKDTLACKILDILIFNSGHDGITTYEVIEKLLVQEGEIGIDDLRKRNARILNAITNKQQGLFRRAKVGNKKLPNKTLKGESIIKSLKGIGLKFNNPNL
jgi:hypothetical protein